MRIITAINNTDIIKKLEKKEKIYILGKDILYKEGVLEILEILEIKENIDFIILNYELPGEIGIEELIDKILEKNKKIKIICLIKQELNKKINFINKIIPIFYNKKIEINEIYKVLNLPKTEKKEKSHIINVFGERQVGKTMSILYMAKDLYIENKKILIMDTRNKNKYLLKYFLKNKINKIKINKNKINKIKNKKFSSVIFIKIKKDFYFAFYDKYIKIDFLEKIKERFDYVFIEKDLGNKAIQESPFFEENIVIVKPNLFGVKKGKEIIEKNKFRNNYKIIINNYNKYSIDDQIIRNIFNKNEIIKKIKYKKEYDKFINYNFPNFENFYKNKRFHAKIKKFIKKRKIDKF